MAKLIYSAIGSLDGFVADAQGEFDWAVPDEEVHAFVNDLERSAGTYLYGRRMYETMVAWETIDAGPEQSAVRDFAELWRAAEKVVFSSTLPSPSSARTRIEREFKPEAVREMKASAQRDITVGGPHLAGQAMAAGLLDECHLILAPIVIGGGTRALPADVRLELELLDQRRLRNGMVHLHYAVSQPKPNRGLAGGRAA